MNARSFGIEVALVSAVAFASLVSILQLTASAQDAPPATPDTVPPVIVQPVDINVTAAEVAGIIINYDLPSATDNVDGAVPVACNPAPGSLFPTGITTVTCTAQDTAGNTATPVSFLVIVAMPPPTSTPLPTSTPPPTNTPIPTNTPEPAHTPSPTSTPKPTSTMVPTDVPAATSTQAPPTATATPTVTPTGTATPRPTPAALPLPASPPPPYVPIIGSGPIDGLSLIWGDLYFPISQEYGHTAFSLRNPEKYAYGALYGLDGRAHPGLDIGMPAGTWLYSPVDGTVMIAGGDPFFTFYGNGQPGVGELMIQTDAGHRVILGHMGRIAVSPGERVATGQFVGLSGGDNGDHLHLEVRLLQAGGYGIVDPRYSFLVETIAAFRASVQPLTCESLITVGADADAWIEQKNPSQNQGADSILYVRSLDAGANTRALIRFALPAEMPEGCAIGTATLRVYASSAMPGNDVEVLRLTGDWSEFAVTWENQPSTADPAVAIAARQGDLEWDVTGQVQATYDEGNNDGFLIRHAAEDGNGIDQQLHSREQAENPPELVIQFTAAPEPTPTATATPAITPTLEASPEATPV